MKVVVKDFIIKGKPCVTENYLFNLDKQKVEAIQ